MQIALGLQAGLLGSSISIFFVSGEYQKMFWLAVFLTMCLPPLVDEIARKQRALRRRADSQLSSKLPGARGIAAPSVCAS
jgi:hypothetical protein